MTDAVSTELEQAATGAKLAEEWLAKAREHVITVQVAGKESVNQARQQAERDVAAAREVQQIADEKAGRAPHTCRPKARPEQRNGEITTCDCGRSFALHVDPYGATNWQNR